MEKIQKVETIKKALSMGATQRQICPQAKAESLRKLLKGNSKVSDKKIDEMYENALHFLENPGFVPHIAENAPSQKIDILKIINEQNNKIKSLEQEIVKIRAILKEVQENKPGTILPLETKNKIENILGFSIIKSTSINKKADKKYRYYIYYAIKTIKGKQVKIYIGKELSNAKEKIENYCKKYKINIE